MSKYPIRHRVRERRRYTWRGKPDRVHRKLQDLVYEAVQIEHEGTSFIYCIKIEDFVLIKRDDEDRPYVAKLLKLYEDGTQQPPTKQAIVQWFIRIEEIPKTKQKLLGREAHPNEIFLCEASNYDNQINVETILKHVKVIQIAPDEPFPPSQPGDDALFVKLNWDGKSFNKLPEDAFSGKAINSSEPFYDHKSLDSLLWHPRKSVNSYPNINCKSQSDSVKKTAKCTFQSKKSTEITKEQSSNSMLVKIPLHNDFKKLSRRKQVDILSELLDDEDDGDEEDDSSRKRHQVEQRPRAVKRRVDFNGISDNHSPSKGLQSQTNINNSISPDVRNRRAMKNQVASLQLSPNVKTSKTIQQDSRPHVRDGRAMKNQVDFLQLSPVVKNSRTIQQDSSPPGNNGEIIDIKRSKRMNSQMDNIQDTPRSCRKSDNKDYYARDQDDEGSDELILDHEKGSESSSVDKEQDDDDASEFRRKCAKTISKSTAKLSEKTSAKRVCYNERPNEQPGTRTPGTPRTPSHPSPCIPRRSQLAKTPVSGLEEARARSKRMKSQMDNIQDTPRSRRKSVNKDYYESDQDDEGSDEFILDHEKSSVSSSVDEEQDDDDVDDDNSEFRRKCAKKISKSTAKLSKKTSAKRPGTRKPGTPRTPSHPSPYIPRRSQLAKNPVSVLEEARARLHVSAVPESLPCREQEFQDIYNFVESKLIDGTGGCMYISGVPGTGKTATVHEVMRCLQHAANEENLPSFQYIEINGMKLTDPHQCYVQILKLLTGQKATADHAAALLEKRFGTPSPKRESTVLLVDELDLLWTRKQNIMYNLFDWPTRRQAKLVVLAVANTMDLPERIMMNRVASRLGLTRMSFQPYSYKQLQQIISSRLNRLRAFENDAIQLVGRKVAALSGDARRALDICRRAAEICEYSENQKRASSLVGMPHILQALDEMFSSPYINAIRHASVQEQIFIKAVLAEFRRLGLEEATFQQIYQQHIGLCRLEGLQPPTISETMLVCTRLGACRLLLVESSKNDLHLRVRLNVSQDDVMYALKED
ncbi:origin recognition complex subunit 1 isoform X3 [Amblyraja radiata]|uniref:origin recognition complex subunit 1 isoform X3 n=1 Tax=Amblyraja radiata TaxID=386614 RepID=UPI001402CFB3|nr:origin recognition complex subunit 1 isoform X3 [Amblyraja radiata]